MFISATNRSIIKLISPFKSAVTSNNLLNFNKRNIFSISNQKTRIIPYSSIYQQKRMLYNKTKSNRDITSDRTKPYIYGSKNLYRSNSYGSKDPSKTPLQLYFQKVGITTSKLLCVNALSGASTIGLCSVLASANMLPSIMVCGAAWFASAIGSMYHAYKLSDPNSATEQSLRHAYWMQGLLGVTIAPSLMIFNAFIPHALITATALTAGPITAAFFSAKGSMLKWGPALYTGLWGLVGIGLASVISPMIGLNSLGITMHSIDLYAGVALFTVYNAYDTHVLINDFERGERNYVMHAANYSLNIVNIFIRLLEIFAKMAEAYKD